MTKEEKVKIIYIFFLVFCGVLGAQTIKFSEKYIFLGLIFIIISGFFMGKYLKKSLGEKYLKLDELGKKHNHKAGYISFNIVSFLIFGLLCVELFFYRILDLFTIEQILIYLLFISWGSFSFFNFYYSKNPDKI